ncbi:MAG: hypothetical protein HC819_19645 [Cyclobacteriaceae bacterium]|nr:hypothetical protein [Cyclobacteriaceae bacterium]
MASPEAVSAIFPMTRLFDLVIFDEASQCFAEQGIPAMYRGRQIVITGDKMQLSPFDLYKVRWEEDFEDNTDASLEVDSLLDLASQYLMQVQLRGHYRSQSLDLIDFSNQHFYKGKLTLLPDKRILDRKQPAISYIKVNGVWAKQVNDEEAIRVVELVKQLLLEQPDKSIGIVSFNARQQEHILDKLEIFAHQEQVSLPQSLFVKNIENVQGDERDVIIFSIAYAPDEKGKMNHHFGSLNTLKGENRLNVAITRAREKICVVTSIWPQQLKVEDTKNEGPKIFRKYLEYALQVSEAAFRPAQTTRQSHSLDWYLKDKIKQFDFESQHTLDLVEEMPFADLTVKAGNEYLGLILTDDELYHESISIKDMHVFTPFTLAAKNWKFMGIHSREYWHDKNAVKDRLLRFVPE